MDQNICRDNEDDIVGEGNEIIVIGVGGDNDGSCMPEKMTAMPC